MEPMREIEEAERVLATGRRVLADRLVRVETHRAACEDTKGNTGEVEYEVHEPAWPEADGPMAEAVLDLLQQTSVAQEWVAALREQNAQRRAEARAAAEAEMHAAADRRVAALRDWALTHGSERVRLLIDEQHRSWADIAADEYILAHTPEGFAELEGSHSVKERTKPTVEDVIALREARAMVEASGGVLSDPKMVWVVIYREATEEETEQGLADSDGEVVAEKYSATRLIVEAPNGERGEVFRRVG